MDLGQREGDHSQWEPGFVDRNITPQHVSVDSTWRSPTHLPCRLQGSGAQGTLPTPAPLGLGLSLPIGVHLTTQREGRSFQELTLCGSSPPFLGVLEPQLPCPRIRCLCRLRVFPGGVRVQPLPSLSHPPFLRVFPSPSQ